MLTAPAYSGSTTTLGTFLPSTIGYLKLYYADWSDTTNAYTYTYTTTLSWVTVNVDRSSAFTGLLVAFDTTGQSDDTYTFVITADNNGESTPTTFSIVVDSTASPSSMYFSSSMYDVLVVDPTADFSIPETKLCVNSNGPVTDIAYTVASSTIASTTSTDEYYLTTSGSTSQPILHINNVDDASVVTTVVSIACTSDGNTIY